jgi:hypothetical protein
VRADQHPTLLWELSARETLAVLDGVAARRRAAHDERMEQAWITARLMAYAPEKPERFMKLDKLLANKARRRIPKQDWKSQEAILATW